MRGIGRVQGTITNRGPVAVTVRVHLYTKSMFQEVGAWNPEVDRPQDYNLALVRAGDPFVTWAVNQSYDFSRLPLDAADAVSPYGDGVAIGDRVSIRAIVERVVPTPVLNLGTIASLEGIVTEGGVADVTWTGGSTSITRAVGEEENVGISLQLGYVGESLGNYNWLWPVVLVSGAILVLPRLLKRARRR